MPVPIMKTIDATAADAGLAKHYVRQLVLQNKVIYVRCGKKYLVNWDRFCDFLNAGDAAPEVEQSCKIRRLG